ncbi:hypothetical protein CAPTEDRAFT_155769 [Capitella teleta]|uniref:Snake toxin/toxin-like domain-containing protein n=1 Tax=Capitella teleta TaxID=283909 RepID=R7V544_CAPTE|nr:hypothetical protein CAPTEDRAFT_155769 [Capitella teleta]|eukprot:ELU10905.1 hypothetical protein CAPTEDRAFT_155769 [Capitella teleta]
MEFFPLAFVYLCVTFLPLADSLECYACKNQDTNKDKCVKTTIQCEENQDTCITTIKWGLPPYWTPYGERFHYVDKDCDTRNHCAQLKEESKLHCKRDWFDDWACVECCTGDLCNYYVTLGADSIRINHLLQLALPSMLSVIIFKRII